MTEQEILKLLHRCGAVITDSHIVYTSGRHGTAYINKDAVYIDTLTVQALCSLFALHFSSFDVDLVIGPATGGIVLSHWTAHELHWTYNRLIYSIYAEKSEDGSFVIKRGYDKLIPCRRVLIVEDILTTGGSAKKVVQAVRALGGEVVGLGALCNRGGVTAEALDVPRLHALVNITLDSWAEKDCPLCKQGVPINTDVGKGREFLAKQKS